MLDIELEDLAQCYNPSCRADIEAPGDKHRYCPKCGAAQVFECPVCPSRPGALLRVAEDAECPRCGAIFTRCRRCYHPIPVTVDQPMVCPEGCRAGLKEARTGTHEPLADIQRTGAVACRARGEQLGEPDVWDMHEAIGKPAARYGRLFMATNRGTIRAIREDGGADVDIWSQTPVFHGGVPHIDGLPVCVSERYVYFVTAGVVAAVSVIDGDPCFEHPIEGAEPTCAIRDDRLLVCARTPDGSLCVRMHDTIALCAGRDSLLREDVLQAQDGGSRQPVSVPAATENSFLVRDMAGSVVEVPLAADAAPRTVWANPGYDYVSVPAIRDQFMYLLAQRGQHDTVVMRVSLTDGSTAMGRLPGVRPAYIGPRVCGPHLYFFDAQRDFYQVDLSAMGAGPRTIFLGVDMTGDVVMEEFVALQAGENGGTWLVSLAGMATKLIPRMVHNQTQARPSLQAPGDGHLALAASDRRIFLADRATGEILAYDIPRR